MSTYAPPPPLPPLPVKAGASQAAQTPRQPAQPPQPSPAHSQQTSSQQQVLPEIADIVASDPGPTWIPEGLEQKSLRQTHSDTSFGVFFTLPKTDTSVLTKSSRKEYLESILTEPTTLVPALTYHPEYTHPSLVAVESRLVSALTENIRLSESLQQLEDRVARRRQEVAAQHQDTRQWEKAWHAQQATLEAALDSSFRAPGLYARLAAAVQEQAAVCEALEESFLEGTPHPRSDRTKSKKSNAARQDRAATTGDEDFYYRSQGVEGHDDPRNGMDHEQEDDDDDDDTTSAAADHARLATEREVLDWVRRYREARTVYWQRKERKARWDEGRVGGWR